MDEVSCCTSLGFYCFTTCVTVSRFASKLFIKLFASSCFSHSSALTYLRSLFTGVFLVLFDVSAVFSCNKMIDGRTTQRHKDIY